MPDTLSSENPLEAAVPLPATLSRSVLVSDFAVHKKDECADAGMWVHRHFDGVLRNHVEVVHYHEWFYELADRGWIKQALRGAARYAPRQGYDLARHSGSS